MNPVVAQGITLGPGVFGAGVVFGLVALDLAVATSAAAVGPRVVGTVTDWQAPQQWRELRDRYAPRPLDAFLLAAWVAVLVELLRSRPTVAAGVAAFSILITLLGSLIFWALETHGGLVGDGDEPDDVAADESDIDGSDTSERDDTNDD